MLNVEEDKLSNAQAALENIGIPDNLLDQAISAGIDKGKRKQKKNQLLIRIFVSAAILVFTFTSMLRTSETFASYINAIPGMEKIVELVRFDKGLTAAIENDFAQKIGVSDEHDGLKITLDSAIVDEQTMILFYKMDSSVDQKEIFISNVKLTNMDGEANVPLEFSSSFWVGPIDLVEKENVYEVTYSFDGKVPPENMKLILQLAEGENGESLNKLEETWVLPFSIDRDAFKDKKEIFVVNESVTIDGQKITVEKVSIYPTRVGVILKYDDKNTKQIFGFEDLRLVDENGEEWAAIANGITASHFSRNRHEIYLQSNYFKKPKELHLRFNSIRALNKKQLEVLVDPMKMEIIQAPLDGKLRKISREDNYLKFTFRGDPKRGIISPFDQAIDSNGEKIGEGNIASSWNGTEGEFEILIPYFGEGAAPGPISLKITDYPSLIKGEADVRLK